MEDESDHTLPSDSLILFEETRDVDAKATGEAQAFELKILSHSFIKQPCSPVIATFIVVVFHTLVRLFQTSHFS